jgi:hypothetical protein
MDTIKLEPWARQTKSIEDSWRSLFYDQDKTCTVILKESDAANQLYNTGHLRHFADIMAKSTGGGDIRKSGAQKASEQPGQA